MDQRVYEVISDRFSLADGSYVLMGTWPLGAMPVAMIGGEVLPTSFFWGEALLEERVKNPDQIYAGRATVKVTLPEELPAKGQLKVFMEKGGEKKPWFSTSVSDLSRRRHGPQYYLEEVVVGDKGIRIRGWVMSPLGVDIYLFDEKGRNLGAKVLRTPRPDVEQVFAEDGLVRESGEAFKPGFYVECERPGGLSLTLAFRSSAGSRTEKIALLGAVRMGQKMLGMGEKGLRYLRSHGAGGFARKAQDKVIHVHDRAISYEKWWARHAVSGSELKKQREEFLTFSYAPLISIVVPLYQTPERYLKELLDSIKAQTYPNWELILSDGSGKEASLSPLVEKLAGGEKRIKLISSPVPLRIVPNTNQAIACAKGEFLAFADHDDVLTPDALYEVVKALQEKPEAKLIYSDEDKMTMDGKKFFQPHFKPDFNGHLLCTVNYICHLMVARKETVLSVSEGEQVLKDSMEGAQDYDLTLRLCEVVPREEILHVAKVLYHWRAHEASTAENPESKSYAFDAGQRALEEHYERLHRPAKVWQGEYPGLYRTRFTWEEKPLVTVLIPNKDHVELLKRCMDSVAKRSTYRNLEFLIVENNSEDEETFAYYKSLQENPWGDEGPKVRVITYQGGFSYSAIHNFAVPQAKGDYVLLLNNDTELIAEDAIEEMLSFCMEPEVGAVGARLYYEDDTIQHAGVVIGFGGVAGHCFVQQPRGFTGYMHRIICTQEYSAVTAACMMIKKKAYEEVGGLAEDLAVAFNDIDFCLKLGKNGYLVVYAPYAELYHYESKSRGLEDTPEKLARFNKEIQVFESRWGKILREGDPYYNKNLTLKSQDFSLRRE